MTHKTPSVRIYAVKAHDTDDMTTLESFKITTLLMEMRGL